MRLTKLNKQRTLLKCKNCNREFPLPAILEVPFYMPGPENEFSKRLIKKPCCPHCNSKDILLTKEELDVIKEEFAIMRTEFATMKQEFSLMKNLI